MKHTPHAESPLDLAWIVDRIETTFARGELEPCMATISAHAVEAWFGVPPQRLSLILEHIVAAGADPDGVAAAMVRIGSGIEFDVARPRGAQFRPPFDGLPFAALLNVARMLHLRQCGRVTEALLEAEEALTHIRVPAFVDLSHGANQLFLVQHGITAILAGSFTRALQCFTEAQLLPVLPTLPFLARDASVKAALLHAAFGSMAEARVLLDQAAELPRSVSWAESVIDASATLAESILSVEDPRRARALLDGLNLRDIGEMWPMYLIAVQRCWERLGLRSELLTRLQGFEQIGWPRVPGHGFTGSVLPLATAATLFAAGDLALGKERLSEADPAFLPTQVIGMLLEAHTGTLPRLQQLSAELARPCAELRQLDLFRRSILANALAAADQHDAVLALLADTGIGRDGAPEAEAWAESKYFTPPVRAAARAAQLAHWPAERESRIEFFAAPDAARPSLSQRELEVLRLLAQGHTRAQLATHLFLSPSTVKSHLHAIYRKLEVSSASEAIRAAGHRGLV